MTTIIRSSSAVRSIVVDILKGECIVHYKNGSVYDYFNVSRLALLNLMLNKNISLGFWINENLLGYDSGVKCLPWVTA
jgi:hypothetical protein